MPTSKAGLVVKLAARREENADRGGRCCDGGVEGCIICSGSRGRGGGHGIENEEEDD